jgi:hypothetical protein
MGQVKMHGKAARRPWPLWLRILECIPVVGLVVAILYIIVGFCWMVIDPGAPPSRWTNDDLGGHDGPDDHDDL